MVQPLRKRRRNGKLYQRRAKVETELKGLEALPLADVLVCVKQGDRGEGPLISSEAIVYVLRREARVATTAGSTMSQVNGLLEKLIQRAELITNRHTWNFDEIDREEICKAVTDRIVDEICAEGDIADYAEVNFNDWLWSNRLDAIRKQKRKT